MPPAVGLPLRAPRRHARLPGSRLALDGGAALHVQRPAHGEDAVQLGHREAGVPGVRQALVGAELRQDADLPVGGVEPVERFAFRDHARGQRRNPGTQELEDLFALVVARFPALQVQHP